MQARICPLHSITLETQNTLCLRTELKRVSNTIAHHPHNLPLTHHQRHIWSLCTRDSAISKKVLKLFRAWRSKRIKSVTWLSKAHLERAHNTFEVKKGLLGRPTKTVR